MRCSGCINVLPIYLFLIKISPKGIPDLLAKPKAEDVPESGIAATKSALTGASVKKSFRCNILIRAQVGNL